MYGSYNINEVFTIEVVEKELALKFRSLGTFKFKLGSFTKKHMGMGPAPGVNFINIGARFFSMKFWRQSQNVTREAAKT